MADALIELGDEVQLLTILYSKARYSRAGLFSDTKAYNTTSPHYGSVMLNSALIGGLPAVMQ